MHKVSIYISNRKNYAKFYHVVNHLINFISSYFLSVFCSRQICREQNAVCFISDLYLRLKIHSDIWFMVSHWFTAD
jgi:hypothetical protein